MTNNEVRLQLHSNAYFTNIRRDDKIQFLSLDVWNKVEIPVWRQVYRQVKIQTKDLIGSL